MCQGELVHAGTGAADRLTDKNDAVVRYTLSKSNQQIFASRYQLYLPTEDELRTELQRERARLEQERSFADEDIT